MWVKVFKESHMSTHSSFLSQFLPNICPLPSSFLFPPLTVSCHAPSSLRSHPPPTLPPLSVSKKGNLCSQTSVDSPETHPNTDAEALCAKEEIKVSDSPQCQAGSMTVNRRLLLEKESDRSRRDWSWTVGENCYTAQWVKQKQEYRSTRPW